MPMQAPVRPRIVRGPSSLSRMRVHWSQGSRRYRASLVSSWLLYVACLPMQAFSTVVPNAGAIPQGHSSGIELLLTGWLGAFGGYFEWLANPLVALAWLLSLLGSQRSAFAAAALATAVALAFMHRSKILVTEAGHQDQIASLDAGYWLWIAAMIVAAATALVALADARRRAV